MVTGPSWVPAACAPAKIKASRTRKLASLIGEPTDHLRAQYRENPMRNERSLPVATEPAKNPCEHENHVTKLPGVAGPGQESVGAGQAPLSVWDKGFHLPNGPRRLLRR